MEKKQTKKKTQTVKGVPIEIEASSRISLKIKDNFYTVEFTERRRVPDDASMDFERAMLWETVNSEVDKQAMEIVDLMTGDTRKKKH